LRSLDSLIASHIT